MNQIAQTAAIMGAGLLGGSVGQAMHARKLFSTIRVWSPSGSTRSACEEADWCDTVHESPETACGDADFVIFCGPVDTIPPLMERLATVCPRECLLTDVGSTKAKICEAGERFFSSPKTATFIGSHPMAGSEKSGLAYAEAGLFAGKTCILTPVGSPAGKLHRLEQFWTSLGMMLFRCGPAEHDRIVAHLSHLPHAMAAVLCASLSGCPPEWLSCAGTGLRDTSRVAAGDPRLWSAIFRENESAFRQSLDGLRESLDDLETALDSDEDEALHAFLKKARDFRLQLDSAASPKASDYE